LGYNEWEINDRIHLRARMAGWPNRQLCVSREDGWKVRRLSGLKRMFCSMKLPSKQSGSCPQILCKKIARPGLSPGVILTTPASAIHPRGLRGLGYSA